METKFNKNFYHERQVETWKRFWEFYGTLVSQNEKSGKAKGLRFESDFVVDLSCSFPLMEQLDCTYIWVEVVRNSPMTPEKKKWLLKMLSEKWLILECGYGKTFEVHRPDAYMEREKRKMTAEDIEKILHSLLQQKAKLRQRLIAPK